jgi:hypothetical protein
LLATPLVDWITKIK